MEALRTEWMQAAAFEELPYITLGKFFQPTAFRRELTGMLQGPTLFWNIKRG